jgi:hypothetical protein
MVQVFEDFTNLEPDDKGYDALDMPERDYIKEFHSRCLDKHINARNLAQWNGEKPGRGKRQKTT